MKPAVRSKNRNGYSSLRVLLVDDHPAVRQGLGMLLGPEGIEVCAEASGPGDALVELEKRHPDLAVVDLSLEGGDGFGLIAELHQRSIPVLVYSMHDDAPHVRAAFAAGALGYVTKRASHDVLVQAIQEVAARRRFISAAAAAAVAESVSGFPGDDIAAKLSPHERDVYKLLGEGADTLDIAAALRVSNHTVESYYERIKVKLKLNGMHELRRHAISHLQKSGA